MILFMNSSANAHQSLEVTTLSIFHVFLTIERQFYWQWLFEAFCHLQVLCSLSVHWFLTTFKVCVYVREGNTNVLHTYKTHIVSCWCKVWFQKKTLYISKLTPSLINKFSMYLLIIFLVVVHLFQLLSFSCWLHLFPHSISPAPAMAGLAVTWNFSSSKQHNMKN